MLEQNYIAIVVGQEGHPFPMSDVLTAVRKNGGKIGNLQKLGSSGHAFSIEYYGGENIGNALKKKFNTNADIAILFPNNLKKKLLLADMDSTIIEQECLDELASYAGVKKQVATITQKAMQGELNFEDALRERVAMLKGIPLKALQECWNKKITISAGAKTLVKTMRRNGARCVLVSGGFTFFTSRVAEAVGFDAHYGNKLLDDGTHLTGEVAEPILGLDSKLQTLLTEVKNSRISAEDAIAIGDGANDLAMIKAAGLGIAVHAKPIVAENSDAAITMTDLASVLYFQGYSEDEFVVDN